MSKIKFTEDGTSFDYHFYLKHQSYENLTQLENEIREIDDEIETGEASLYFVTKVRPLLFVRNLGNVEDFTSKMVSAFSEDYENAPLVVKEQYKDIVDGYSLFQKNYNQAVREPYYA